MTLPVAILAGGLATRLRPLTERIPKALLEVGGQPFIAHQLSYLRRQGIERVVLCVGHLADQVRAFVGDGSLFGIEVDYSMDGPFLLGTGGAIKRAIPLLGDCFFVQYGDSFLPIEYGAVRSAFHRCTKPALMTVLKNDNRWDKSNVLYRDGMVVEYNKLQRRDGMDYIDYGLSILSAGVFDNIDASAPVDLSDILHRLSVEGNLAGHEVTERFYEIGSVSGIRDTEDFLKGRTT